MNACRMHARQMRNKRPTEMPVPPDQIWIWRKMARAKQDIRHIKERYHQRMYMTRCTPIHSTRRPERVVQSRLYHNFAILRGGSLFPFWTRIWQCQKARARRAARRRARSGVLGVDSEPLAVIFLSEDARPKVKYPGSARFQHNPERIAAATRPDIAAKLARAAPARSRSFVSGPSP